MDAPIPLWILRAAWLTLPFTAWAGVAAAVEGASPAVRVTAAGVGWLVWAAALVASALVRPRALVALRLLVPLAPAATAVALLMAEGDGALNAGGGDTVRALVGFVAGVGATGLAMLPVVGSYFLNGASYGDEQRFGLRSPGPLLIVLGPLWILGAGLPVAAVALLAAQRWVLGGAALVAGTAGAWWLWVVTSRLAGRYAVFVPAGLTLVDPLTLADPVLFARSRTVSLGPAPLEGERADLTGGALGLVVELRTDAPTEIVTMERGPDPRATGADRPRSARMAAPQDAPAVLFTPAQPAELLTVARRRGFEVR
ncbi:MAG: hypothetical protein R2754_01290 [Microthrixaceae bacterium]